MPARRPLWRCPRCGHRYVTRNLWHSCARYRVADHFRGKDPQVRRLFDRFRDLVRACGRVHMYAQRTRIVFQARARFAGAVPRKRWLDCGLWLKRRVESRRFRRIEAIPPGSFIHHFRVTKPEELDEVIVALVREAYAVGKQEWEGRPWTA